MREAPLPPIVQPMATSAVQPALVRRSGGGNVLASDVRLAYILLNDARYRAFGRVFGCSREQTNLATLVGGLALTEAFGTRLHRIMTAPMAPSAPASLLSTASFRELLSGVAGPSVQETPGLGTLLMLAVLAGGAAPTLIRSAHGMRRISHEINAAFRARYGYLVDPGSLRRHHYETRARAATVLGTNRDDVPAFRPAP